MGNTVKETNKNLVSSKIMEKRNNNKNVKKRLIRKKFRFELFKIREIGVLIALILLSLIFSLLSPYFLGVNNLLNIVRQISLTGIMAVGMTMVIVTGEIDLSVGACYGLSAIVAGLAMSNGFTIWSSILIALATGLLGGILNGLLVTYGRIPALIVTLGMLNIARGAALLLSHGLPISVNKRTVIDPNVSKFLFLGQGKIFNTVPMMIVFLLGVFIIGYAVFNKTIYGFHMKAVGGNPIAARASGLNVKKIKILAFSITGFLCALAGILNLSFLANVQGTVGTGLELEVIAAVIIGGTSLAGGEGTILGTLIGVLIMGVLRNGLVLLGVSPFWQILLIGVVIIGAVGIDMWTRRKSI